MRQKIKKTGKRSAALALCGALSLSFLAGGIASAVGGKYQAFASTADTITINTGMKYQTLDGWGSTLAWWANEIGDWTKPSAVGTTQREYIMELLYGKDGLDWNIARYNIGGGDDPSHTHMPDARNMPGFKGAREKTEEEKADPDNPYAGNFVPDELYCFEDPSGMTKSWEQTTDYNQLWVLDWIQKNRDDVMTEFFSNSPPYWMTKSGCASGMEDGSANLRDEYIEGYVDYFLDVYEYLLSQGFEFDYLQPFNESTSGQWHGFTGSQEGCDFTIEQKIEVLARLQDEVKARGYDIGYNYSDEVDSSKDVEVFSDTYNSSYKASNGMTGKDIIKNAEKFTYHIYGYTTGSASWLRRAANLFDKEVEMSEICWTRGDKHDVNDMSTAFQYSTSIIDILKYGGAQSYIFWQGVEDKVGQINGGSNYGLLQGVYYSAEEALEKGVDIASLGLAYQDVTTSKAYYVTGQYSKYMKKGYTIIECLGDRSLAAVSPNGDEVVIVKQNDDKSPKELTFNLDGFNATGITKVTTDETQNWGKEYLGVSGTTFKDTVSANSVTTYIIEGVQTKGDSHFIDSSDIELKNEVTINGDREFTFSNNYKFSEINALITEEPEEEALYITFANQHDKSKYKDNGGKSKDYLYGGTFYTNNTADYVVLHFKGTGFSLIAPQKSDAGTVNIWIDPQIQGNTISSSSTPVEVSLKKTESIWRGEVYRNNELDDGWHTVYVSPKSGYFNFDGFFVFTEKDKTADAIVAPTLNDAAASLKDGKLFAGFQKDDSLTEGGYEYFMEYRKAGGEWVRSSVQAVEADGAFLIEDTPSFHADRYDVRVVAVKGADTRVSSAKAVYFNPTKSGVLYYVDCGTGIYSNTFAGRVLGEYNSAYDKPFGTDLATGKAWGYLNVNGSTSGHYPADDAFGSVASGDFTTDNKITYKFTIPTAGTYRMTLGTFDPWSTRVGEYTLTGDQGMAQISGSFTTQKSARLEVLTFTTAADNEVVTLTVSKQEGTNDNPLLALIVIADESTKLPMYADAVSDYAEQVIAQMSTLAIGTNFMTDGLQAVEIKVMMSDGSEEVHSVANGNLIFKSATLNSVANGSAIYATYELNFDGMSKMTVEKSFQAAQSGKETYYNIDTGSDGTNAGTPGTKQGSSPDQEDDGSTWGYFNAGGANWKNEGIESSIREFAKSGDSGYNLRGFAANENLTVTIGSNVHDWGSRTTAVKFNGGSEQSNKLMPQANGGNVEQTYSTKADASGNLKISFVTKTSNEGPQISYVRVESVPTGGSSLITTVPNALTADKASYTPTNEGEKIVLSNVAEGATVYVLDSENNFVDCISVPGTASATPTYTTLEWKAWDKLGEYAEGVRFMQAFVGNANASAELALSLVVKPMLDIQFERDAVEDGSVIALRFKPVFPEGSKRSVSEFRLRLTDGVEVNIIDSFFFRTIYNGNYTAIMKVDGVTYEYPFTVDVIDTIILNVEKNEAFTSDPVSVTLTPGSTKGVARMLVNGEEKQLSGGKFEFSATQNGEYTVVVVSASGFQKAFTFVIDNIEPATPSLNISISYDFAAGLKVNYSTNAAGGALYVSVNGKAATKVEEDIDLLASNDGKYVFYYQSGTGVKSAEQVYYVTHNVDEARLATVDVAKNGTVSVAGSGVTAQLFRAGDKTPLDQMNVSGNGKYYLELTSAEGTEIVVIGTSAALDIDWIGLSNVANVALTIVFSLLAAGLVAGTVAIVIIKRRKS